MTVVVAVVIVMVVVVEALAMAAAFALAVVMAAVVVEVLMLLLGTWMSLFITDPLARGSLRQQAHQVRAARQAPTMQRRKRGRPTCAMCMRTAWVGGWATTRQCKEEKDDLLRTCAA